MRRASLAIAAALLCLMCGAGRAALYEFRLSGDAAVSVNGATAMPTTLTFTGIADPANARGRRVDWWLPGIELRFSESTIVTASSTLVPQSPGQLTQIVDRFFYSPSGPEWANQFWGPTAIARDWLGTLTMPNEATVIFTPNAAPQPLSVVLDARGMYDPVTRQPIPGGLETGTRRAALADGTLTYTWTGNPLFTAAPLAAVPEPAILACLAAGLLLMFSRQRVSCRSGEPACEL